MSNGDTNEYEEFATKFRSQIATGNPNLAKLMDAIENE